MCEQYIHPPQAQDRKPKTEEKNPKLLAEIHAIMEPQSESESSLRTTLLYTDMTAMTVYEALVAKGWSTVPVRGSPFFPRISEGDVLGS